MLAFLTALFLGSGDPVDLVRDLADDSIEIRERAAAELYRRGEEIRGFVMEACETAADLEAGDRLRDILRRLDADARIREFGGSNRVAGFGASLRSDRFFGSGPFRLSVEVMNLGPKEQVLPGIGTWDLELPDQELRTPGADARVALRKFAGAPGLRRTSWRSGEGSPRTPSVLRPGECAQFEYILDVRSLPVGDYQVTVEFLTRELIPDAGENLRTNSVHLMIRK